MTSGVTANRDTRCMNELIQGLASYGLAGLLLGGGGWLLYKMIERGFELKIPPRDD